MRGAHRSPASIACTCRMHSDPAGHQVMSDEESVPTCIGNVRNTGYQCDGTLFAPFTIPTVQCGVPSNQIHVQHPPKKCSQVVGCRNHLGGARRKLRRSEFEET